MNNKNPYINIILGIEKQKENLSLNLDRRPPPGAYYYNSGIFNLDFQLEHFKKLSGIWENVNNYLEL
jgi:hypothetical protein